MLRFHLSEHEGFEREIKGINTRRFSNIFRFIAVYCLRVSEVASVGLRDQDRLDGASNFGIWKFKILLLLEHRLKEYATYLVVIPIDLTQLAT